MNAFNPYAILGVKEDCSQEEIKAAWRLKARQYHPDRGCQDSNILKNINAAYDSLKNDEKRRAYHASAKNKRDNSQDIFKDIFEKQFSDIFKSKFKDYEDVMEDRKAKKANQDCIPAEATVMINFSTSMKGGVVEMEFYDHKIEVIIDPYTRHNQTFRLKDADRRRPAHPRDIMVTIHVSHDPLYSLEDNDLVLGAIPISMILASIGGIARICLPDETQVELPVPAGFQGGEIIVPHGGFPSQCGQKGNLRVGIYVETPTNLSSYEKDILRNIFSKDRYWDVFPQSAKAKENHQNRSFY